MTPLRPRYGKIEKLVDAVLLEAGIVGPAVPIEKIVRKHRIDLKIGNLEDVSGLLVRVADGVTIGVNGSHPEVRKRFTIAHEFGHYMLHSGISAHYDRDYRINFRSRESSEATNIEEIEANFFAASILMPKHFLDRNEAVLSLDNDEEVARLAKKYNVSRHAMSLRLGNVYRVHRPF
jgi:Zn-dependent peptidase ImmA (M78 family)